MFRLRSVDIAALRHRMVLQTPLNVSDGAGGLTRAWHDEEVVWAALETLDAHAVVEDNRRFPRLTHRILLRWRADIDSSMRLRLGGRIFVIHSISDADERRRFVSLMVEEEGE